MSDLSFPSIPGSGQPVSSSPDVNVLPPGLHFVPIACSPDMMAPLATFFRPPSDFFGHPVIDQSFPYLWRSSLALSVAEDPFVDPCVDDAATRVSYLKVTATITGYQRHPLRDSSLLPTFLTGTEPDLQRLLEPDLGEYLPCYGALLRVQVFPGIEGVPLARYPKIVDFEPKMRELYQPASETAQMLSGSSSTARIDRTTKSVQSTEWGLSGTVTASYGLGGGNQESGPGASVSVTGSYKSTTTDETTGQIGGDQTTGSQATSGTVVNISQIYSVLTGYHAGTNTASILIQPRPHIEQAQFTIRNFVPGMRAIEGIQEAVFVIVRPKSMTSLRVQATLETAHLSAADVTPRPPVDPNPSHLDRPDTSILGTVNPFGDPAPFMPKYTAYSRAADDPPGGDFAQRVWLFQLNPAFDSEGYELEIDTSAGDGAEHPGVTKVADASPRHDQGRILLEEYGVISSNTFRVAITQRPDVTGTDGPPNWLKVYAPWVRRRYPDPVPFRAETAALLTVRETCGAYNLDDHGCIVPVAPAREGVPGSTGGSAPSVTGSGASTAGSSGSGGDPAPAPPPFPESIVDERKIAYEVPALDRAGASAAASAIGSQLRALLTGARAYPAGLVRIDTSDFGAAKLAQTLDKRAAAQALASLAGAEPAAELKDVTVSELLATPMKDLAAKRKVAVAAVALLRERVLSLLAAQKQA